MPSPRDHIETHVFDPPTGGTVAAAETAILSLLTAVEQHQVGSPAAMAFIAPIRRKGEELLTAGGASDVLDYMANRIHAAVPEKAAQRERILAAAWGGLPGWWS
ncbi:hypothetical protein MKK55_14400 [Methylobacterium sp. J-059]|uniref:hypothetical protein n=1 Tax=Methylobacterium sp. J-059 TaxID=2836643 RepID=UPI001FB8930D|nr:hypothetical protein [Methylobacterium sp. J-059]MCJ2040121.1 hypothetical protein [Methylobacterium sp. J-059]